VVLIKDIEGIIPFFLRSRSSSYDDIEVLANEQKVIYAKSECSS
jgi:hypothetical protein